jgi:chloramphenicol 3-O phosphotransferase
MPGDASGRVILLIGCSCAGKTTLARAIQEHASEHYLSLSLDRLFAAVAERWGSGGTFREQGFSYAWEQPVAEGGLSTRRIVHGPVGRGALEGFHAAVGAYARKGVNVVVDDMLIDDAALWDWDAPWRACRLCWCM